MRSHVGELSPRVASPSIFDESKGFSLHLHQREVKIVAKAAFIVFTLDGGGLSKADLLVPTFFFLLPSYFGKTMGLF